MQVAHVTAPCSHDARWCHRYQEIHIFNCKIACMFTFSNTSYCIWSGDKSAMGCKKWKGITSLPTSFQASWCYLVHPSRWSCQVFAGRCQERVSSCLVHYSQQCGVPTITQRLRHTLASAMMADGIPESPLQRYFRHEHLDPTIIFIEVTVSLLHRDYCQGISVLNPGRKNLSMRE